jgi:hypothetical protein
MTWQPETPTMQLGKPLDLQQEWQRAFMAEWYRLSEGCADLEQTADFAAELYASRGTCSPVEVAREEWGTPA